MERRIALLRGINVGGRNSVPMVRLRELVSGLGFDRVQTLLQSGNLVFAADGHSDTDVESRLESELEREFGVRVEIFVRTADEWDAMIARNPYSEAALNDPSHLVVLFMKGEPSIEAIDELRAAIRGPETIVADGRQLYMVYPAGIGDSKLTNALIESKLRLSGTARNWNTIVKLAALARG